MFPIQIGILEVLGASCLRQRETKEAFNYALSLFRTHGVYVPFSSKNQWANRPSWLRRANFVRLIPPSKEAEEEKRQLHDSNMRPRTESISFMPSTFLGEGIFRVDRLNHSAKLS